MPRTAILYVTERCNQACVFCLEEDGLALRPDLPPAQVTADLASLRARGAEHLTFMGGETFLRKDLPELLTEARRVGFTRVGVTTNGTALAHPGFVVRMVEAGLEFVEISVHADEAALAEAISGKAFTWERQQRALTELEEVRDRLLVVIVNVVICRENHDRLVPIVRELLERHPRLRPLVKLKFVSVIGAEDRRDAVPLRYDEVDLAPVIALLRERGVAYWLYNFPLCRAPGGAEVVARCHESEAFVLDWTYHDYDHRRRDGYYDSGHQLEGNVWPAPPCDGCSMAPLCPGIEETYRRRHGEGEFRARHEASLPAVTAILTAAGADASKAEDVLVRLAKRPRPARFAAEVLPKPGEAVVVFGHPAFDETLAFELRRPDRQPAFASTPTLALSYRRTRRDPGSEAAGRELLERLEQALQEADAAGEPIVRAAKRLEDVAGGTAGWTCFDVRLGPVPPDADRPLAIRVPARH
jgi:MoaA/NifB/PqqE/SkfB family radical SAM enzyme